MFVLVMQLFTNTVIGHGKHLRKEGATEVEPVTSLFFLDWVTRRYLDVLTWIR